MSERTHGYTTRQAADASGLSTSKVLSWTRAGVLTPSKAADGEYLFSFQDVVLLRTARGLLEADVPARRIRSAVKALRAQLPADQPLSGVRIAALGARVLVRERGNLWEPDSGQLQLDFDVASPGSPADADAVLPTAGDAPADTADVALPAAHYRTVADTADDWYDRGVDLEATDPARAAEAYARALELDGDHADAHLNLGRLLHEAGDLNGAEGHYRAAKAAAPASAQASFNLGVVLEDQGRPVHAIAAYREALRLDQAMAAAHYNLGRLLEARGDRAGAMHHLAVYRRL